MHYRFIFITIFLSAIYLSGMKQGTARMCLQEQSPLFALPAEMHDYVLNRTIASSDSLDEALKIIGQLRLICKRTYSQLADTKALSMRYADSFNQFSAEEKNELLYATITDITQWRTELLIYLGANICDGFLHAATIQGNLPLIRLLFDKGVSASALEDRKSVV